MCLYLVLLSGIHYKKIRGANATFSLAQKSLTVGQYFPMQNLVKTDGSFVIIDEETKAITSKAIASKLLQQSQCKVTQLFLSPTLSYLCLLRIQKIWFFLGQFLTYPGNKHNDNCFFNLYRKYYPQSSHPTLKLCLALRPRAIFFGIDEKIIALLHYCIILQPSITVQLPIYCLKFPVSQVFY